MIILQVVKSRWKADEAGTSASIDLSSDIVQPQWNVRSAAAAGNTKRNINFRSVSAMRIWQKTCYQQMYG